MAIELAGRPTVFTDPLFDELVLQLGFIKRIVGTRTVEDQQPVLAKFKELEEAIKALKRSTTVEAINRNKANIEMVFKQLYRQILPIKGQEHEYKELVKMFKNTVKSIAKKHMPPVCMQCGTPVSRIQEFCNACLKKKQEEYEKLMATLKPRVADVYDPTAPPPYSEANPLPALLLPMAAGAAAGLIPDNNPQVSKSGTLSCGHAPTWTPEGPHRIGLKCKKPAKTLSTGTARMRDSQEICHPCAEIQEYKQFLSGNQYMGYISGDSKYVTTWTGGILANVSGFHKTEAGWQGAMTDGRYYFRAKDEKGGQWYGNSPGPGMYCRLHRVGSEEEFEGNPRPEPCLVCGGPTRMNYGARLCMGCNKITQRCVCGNVARAESNPPTVADSIRFREIYDEAHAAGMAAGTSMSPTPMNIKGYAPIMDGVCGFAWIIFKPATKPFTRWMKANSLAKPDEYYGGVRIWVGEFEQSMERKEAYATAFANIIKKYPELGVSATAMSRVD